MRHVRGILPVHSPKYVTALQSFHDFNAIFAMTYSIMLTVSNSGMQRFHKLRTRGFYMPQANIRNTQRYVITK